jgi:hypothetical protein
VGVCVGEVKLHSTIDGSNLRVIKRTRASAGLDPLYLILLDQRSTPAAFAVCVAIASINGGDKQS